MTGIVGRTYWTGSQEVFVNNEATDIHGTELYAVVYKEPVGTQIFDHVRFAVKSLFDEKVKTGKYKEMKKESEK